MWCAVLTTVWICWCRLCKWCVYLQNNHQIHCQTWKIHYFLENLPTMECYSLYHTGKVPGNGWLQQTYDIVLVLASCPYPIWGSHHVHKHSSLRSVQWQQQCCMLVQGGSYHSSIKAYLSSTPLHLWPGFPWNNSACHNWHKSHAHRLVHQVGHTTCFEWMHTHCGKPQLVQARPLIIYVSVFHTL